MNNLLKRIQVFIHIKLLDNSWSSFQLLIMMIRAIFCKAKFEQVGESRAPKMWRVYWWTTTFDVGSSRRTKRRAFWSASRTPTCANIPLILAAETPYLCWLSLTSTKKRLWRRSGPTNRDLFKEAPLKSLNHLVVGTPYRVRLRSNPDNAGDTPHNWSWFGIVCLKVTGIFFLFIISNYFGVCLTESVRSFSNLFSKNFNWAKEE